MLAGRRPARAPRLGQPRGDRPPHDRPRPTGGPPRGPRARRSGAAVPPDARSRLHGHPRLCGARGRGLLPARTGAVPESSGDTPQLVPVLHGLWTYHIVRAQHTSALALGEQVLQLGAATNDDGLLLQGNMEVGWSHYFLGELEQAREHLERVLALYDHERHSSHAFTYGDNPATSARSELAQVLWLLGYVGPVAAATARRTWRSFGRWSSTPTASPLDSPGRFRAPVSRRCRRRPARWSTRRSRSQKRMASRSSARWPPCSKAGRSPRRAISTEGIAQMRHGLAAQLATGAELARPYWLCLIAEACLETGAAREGLALLDDAEAAVEQTDERYWEAEIHRLRGQLLLAASDPASSGGGPRRLRRATAVRSRSRADRARARSSCAPRSRCRDCGRPRTAMTKPASCWRPSTSGSPKAWTIPSCARRPRSWTSSRSAMNPT